MKQLVNEVGTDNCLLLNTGNAFNRVGDSELEHRRAALILDAYERIGYEVYAPGPFDAVFGLDEFESLASKHFYPLVCANLVPGVAPLIKTHVVLEKQGRKVLVTSVVDPQLAALTKEKRNIDFPVIDPAPQLQKIFSGGGYDLSILVVHTTREWLPEFVATLGVHPDVVVLGYQLGVLPPAEDSDSEASILIANNDKGKGLCALDLLPDGNGWQSAGWRDKTLSMKKVTPEPELDALLADQEAWEKKYMHQKRMAERHASKAAHGSDLYLGAVWCQRCHPKIYARWQQTPHAKAIDILKQQGRDDDHRCLPCHVTGMETEDSTVTGEVKGFISFTATPHLTNVQCEACHGPGKMHTRNPAEYPLLPGDATSCRKCHTEDRSPGFIYDPAAVH